MSGLKSNKQPNVEDLGQKIRWGSYYVTLSSINLLGICCYWHNQMPERTERTERALVNCENKYQLTPGQKKSDPEWAAGPWGALHSRHQTTAINVTFTHDNSSSTEVLLKLNVCQWRLRPNQQVNNRGEGEKKHRDSVILVKLHQFNDNKYQYFIR